MSRFLPELSQSLQGLATGRIKDNKYTDRIVLFGGVLLPLIAAVFEATTHFCAHHFFEPFPSTNHLLLFLPIPLSNFLALLARQLLLLAVISAVVANALRVSSLFYLESGIVKIIARFA
jgi:hypothetical protein